MRSSILVILLLACGAFSNAHQTKCPKVELIGPSGVTHGGDTLTYVVSLSSTPANIKYSWTVSHGVIETGQGTQSIIVRSTRADGAQEIVATVKIEGLPEGCNEDFSERGLIHEV